MPRWLRASVCAVVVCGCTEDGLKSVEMMPDPVDCLEGGSLDAFRSCGLELSIHHDVDVLFVVDDASVAPQARLAAAARSFVEAARAREPLVDLRIGVVSTDNGNPACDLELDAGGSLEATSCRSRPEQFDSPEAFAAACTDQCTLDSLELRPTTTAVDEQPRVRPWIEDAPAFGGNLPEGVSLAEAVGCMLPQGNVGCPLRSPLGAVVSASQRWNNPADPGYAFFRGTARGRIVVFVNAGVDCSVNPEGASAFEPDGNHALWSDPQAEEPTPAACWNAGVACEGDPTALSCEPANFYPEGEPASVARFSVLHPMGGLSDRVQDAITGYSPTEVFVLAGVPVDWTADDPVPYAAATDPDVALEIGIAPGCTLDDVPVPPPVRMLAFAQRYAADTSSVCAPDYTELVDDLVAAVDRFVVPSCFSGCVADVDTTADGVQPDCAVEFRVPSDGTVQISHVPQCLAGPDGDAVIPDDAMVCWTPRTGASIDPECAQYGFNLEIELTWRGPIPPGARVLPRCTPSDDEQTDCPDLP